MTTNILERPLARRWDFRLPVLLGLVFLVGAAAGAVVMQPTVHAYLLHRQPAFDTPQGRSLNFEKLQKELNLTPPQAEQVQSILNDFWQYYRTVLSDSKARVEQVLTEEQRQKFERLLQQQR